MSDRELKRLSRKQLLELLLQLTEKSEQLQKDLEEANKKLKNRILIKSEAGSIAEASLKLNGVFDAAENAASQYLYSLKVLSENQDVIKKRYEEECRKRAGAMLRETDKRCKAIEAASRKKADEIIAEAKSRAKIQADEAEKKLNEVKRLYKYVLDEKKKLQSTVTRTKKTNG